MMYFRKINTVFLIKTKIHAQQILDYIASK